MSSMTERVSYEQMDRATWRALQRAYRIAEKALRRIAAADTVAHETAEQALREMQAEVEACE